MSSAVDNDLAEIVGLILGREIAPGADLVREDTPGWDSLKNLEIIFAVESAFAVSFTPDEMAAIRSLADIRAKLSPPDAS
ncbi:acyl carrier protein [Phenylobacterium sp. 20VBR1]|uniref:Acyl carrier protein n=1 Tax=Phenylobacterium glaciei TaxID=2803784 RepID=A0A941HUV4_9CAUL|nr:acyl carrier protein [Phenylobacterium glaciei]MBR7619069.1 acyl carrier protein [Phenylobacterium glaciei]